MFRAKGNGISQAEEDCELWSHRLTGDVHHDDRLLGKVESCSPVSGSPPAPRTSSKIGPRITYTPRDWRLAIIESPPQPRANHNSPSNLEPTTIISQPSVFFSSSLSSSRIPAMTTLIRAAFVRFFPIHSRPSFLTTPIGCGHECDCCCRRDRPQCPRSHAWSPR